MKLSDNERIIIIEGIAGAGKSTLLKNLRKDNSEKRVRILNEAEMMFSWNMTYGFDVEKLRLQFMNKVLDHIEKRIKEENCIFVLERFHISAWVLRTDMSKEFDENYHNLVERVRSLPAKVLIPHLKNEDIEKRSLHHERDQDWKEYLQLKLKKREFTDIVEMYIAEQESVLNVAKEQKIPYEIIELNIDHKK